MRFFNIQQQAALEAETVAPRDFITIFPRNRETGEEVMDAYWSDFGSFSTQVIDPNTGLSIPRTFAGGGELIRVSPVPLVVGLIVQEVSVVLSQVDDHVQELFRTYSAKQCRVELHRGLMDLSSGLLLGPAIPRFSGFINHIEVSTASENSEGSVSVTCVSHTQEATRYNASTRSDADQRLRNASDAFFENAATVADWTIYWGQESA